MDCELDREKMENLQDEAAVAYMAYTEVWEKRKSSMLDAYNDIKDFNLMYNVECASGFHFFRTRKEAEEYR